MLVRSEIIDYFKEYERMEIKAVPRELKISLSSNFIISIIGPRRAGKTYYLLSLFKGLNAIYLNFDDSRLYNIEHKDIREITRIFIEIYGKKAEYLVLDEVQNIKNWELVVREMYDLKKYKIFVTGSSSKFLSREIATQLRGRSLSYLLLPFSFREFLLAKKVNIDKYLAKDDEAQIKHLLKEYVEFGGFPDVVLNKEKINILKEYNDLLLFRDFVERHNIKNINLARFILTFVIQNFSKEISLKKVYDRVKYLNIKVSKDKVYDYITKLEDTSFFFFLKKLSFKPHLRETWPKKMYLCDPGLNKIVKFSPNYGRNIENIVFLELLRKTNDNPLLEIYYFKDYQQHEVDFVVKEGLNVKQLIQVTYASDRDEIDKREIRALLKASDVLSCKDLLVITWDYEAHEEIKGKKIKFMPLWKWLLEK